VSAWTTADIPSLSGRTTLVTGANSGIGFHTARSLAEHGAEVVMAGRDDAAGAAAIQRIRAELPEATVSWLHLDLSSLDSVREASERFRSEHEKLDILVNNAGVMMVPRRLTADGFESQFGVNHLGHFALTGRLLPALLSAPGARVVSVSSLYHREGRIDFDDLMGDRAYNPTKNYAQSKLANLLFAFELARLAAASGTPLASIGAHPGVAATNLGHDAGAIRSLLIKAFQLTTQPAEGGSYPSLFAATSPLAVNGSFVGPDGRGGHRGAPQVVEAAPQAHDEAAARRLWNVSTELTGVEFTAVGGA
jgi:NAD(P)-dependent dehydrogenase (short-subunit alcohol dehydrogenase family)